MDLFTTSSIGTTLSEITASISSNIGAVLIIFGFIVGISIVASLINEATGTGYGHGEWRGPSGKNHKY